MERQCKHGRIYVCKRIALLQYLLDAGFEPARSIPDPDNLKFKWWVFDNSPELEDTITAYFNK